MQIIKLATRKSPLAQIQADFVGRLLQARAGVTCEKVCFTTQGDQMLHLALDTLGGKGLFVKELETALFAGHADAAVHSMKDVPADLPAGCEIAALTRREDVRDAFIGRAGVHFADLPDGARIGTSSRRRALQLCALRPDLVIVPLRGNVQTRLQKLTTDHLDGTVLAVAGLNRLGLAHVITDYFEPTQMVPAVGQGALGLEILTNHARADLFRALDDAATRVCVTAERSFMHTLQADCHAAVGAYARLEGDQLHVCGMFEVNGQMVKAELWGEHTACFRLGQQLAAEILTRGHFDATTREERTSCQPTNMNA